jgi:HK97 family phage portal protein
MRLLARLANWAYPALPAAGNRRPSDALAATAHGIVATSIQGKPQWPKREVGVYEREGYERLALGFACVGIVADTGSSVPLRVYEERPDGTTPNLPNHAMMALMRRPNPEMWQGEFVWQVLATAAVAGFCVVEKVRSAAGRVVELWPLDPCRLRAIPRNQAPPDWCYKVGSTEIELAAEDVLVYRWKNRMGRSPFGIGPFEVLFREIGLQNSMQDFLKGFFDGGAMPLQMVVIDTLPGQTLTQEQKDLYREQFRRRHLGLRNAWEPIFSGGIKDVKQIGFDFEELAWEKLRDLNDLAICQAFGVPASMAQIRVGLENATNRANIEADELRLYRQVIVPQLARLDGVLTLGLLPEFEPPGSRVSLEFDYSNVSALKEDLSKEIEMFRGAMREGGVTPNDLRRKMGLPELPPAIGDVLYIPLFVSPIDVRTGEARPATSPVSPPSGNGDEPPPQLRRALQRIDTYQAIAAGPTRYERLAAIGTANRAAHQAIAAARRASIAAYFDGLAERVLDKVALSTFTRPGETLALADVEWAAEDRMLGAILRQLYALAAQTSWTNAADQLGVSIAFDLANPRVRDVMDKLALRVAGIGDTSRQLIAEQITKAAEDGIGLDALKDRLRTMFAGWSEHRAAAVARTESMMSYGLASAAAYAESGVVDRLLLLDNETHTDHYGAEDGWSCAERNGKTVPLDDADKHLGSEHVNGSLALAPVLIGEE